MGPCLLRERERERERKVLPPEDVTVVPPRHRRALSFNVINAKCHRRKRRGLSAADRDTSTVPLHTNGSEALTHGERKTTLEGEKESRVERQRGRERERGGRQGDRLGCVWGVCLGCWLKGRH